MISLLMLNLPGPTSLFFPSLCATDPIRTIIRRSTEYTRSPLAPSSPSGAAHPSPSHQAPSEPWHFLAVSPHPHLLNNHKLSNRHPPQRVGSGLVAAARAIGVACGMARSPLNNWVPRCLHTSHGPRATPGGGRLVASTDQFGDRGFMGQSRRADDIGFPDGLCTDVR
jgi:hypothetical protein